MKSYRLKKNRKVNAHQLLCGSYSEPFLTSILDSNPSSPSEAFKGFIHSATTFISLELELENCEKIAV